MDKIWWQQFNSPRRFIRDAAESLANGKSIVLRLPKRVPWLETMREVFEKRLRKSGTLSIEVVDAENIAEPPEFVFEEFCEAKDGFRPVNKTAYAKFLAQRTGISLNSSCIWIRNAETAQIKQWFAFIADYHKFLNGKRGGVFFLETGDDLSFAAASGVEILSYAKKISDYDCFAFNIFVAAEFGKENHLIKQYLAELVSALTEGDVEFGAECIKRGESLLQNPAVVFENILSTDAFTSHKSAEDVERAIWLTQMKLVFPLVETFRRNFIKKYEMTLKTTPPYPDAPEELEIGNLYGLFSPKRWLLDSEDADDLEMYREIRNKLAHLKILPFDELQRLFDRNSRR